MKYAKNDANELGNQTSFYVNPEEVYKGHFVLKQILKC